MPDARRTEAPGRILAGMVAAAAVAVAVAVAIAFAGKASAAEPEPLIDAVRHGTAEEVGRLLSAGADPESAQADGTSALHWVVHHGALEAAADRANRYGVRPSYLAAENGDAAMLAALLEAGADPNAVFAEGETLLMTAARTGDVAAIETLIAAGANVRATEDRGGQTALMWAAAENNGPAFTALIAAGAERDAREVTGEFTALAFAVRAGAADSARALLEAGADPDAAVKGWTAMHEIALVRRWNRGFNLPGPEQDDDLSGLELVRELPRMAPTSMPGSRSASTAAAA